MQSQSGTKPYAMRDTIRITTKTRYSCRRLWGSYWPTTNGRESPAFSKELEPRQMTFVPDSVSSVVVLFSLRFPPQSSVSLPIAAPAVGQRRPGRPTPCQALRLPPSFRPSTAWCALWGIRLATWCGSRWPKAAFRDASAGVACTCYGSWSAADSRCTGMESHRYVSEGVPRSKTPKREYNT